MRELEQAVRRILLTHHYTGDTKKAASDPDRVLAAEIHAGTLNARELLSRYCGLLINGWERWKKWRAAPGSIGAR